METTHARIMRSMLAASLALVACGTGAERAEEVPLAVRTDTLAVIGAAEGGGPAVFGRVRDVAFDPEGRLLVLDDLSSRVVVFDTAGRHRLTVGRAGEGPGEFGNAIAVAAAGAHIVVYDLRKRAFHAFDAGGRFTRQIGLPGGVRGDEESVHGLGTDAIVFVEAGTLMVEPDSLSVYRVAIDGEAEPRAVLEIPNPQETPQVAGVSRTPEGNFSITRRLRASFYPTAHIAPLRDERLAVAAWADYRILVAGDDGEVRDTLSRPVPVRAVEEEHRSAERERRRAAMSEAFGQGGGAFGVTMSASRIDRAVENLLFPDSLPVVRGLLSAPDGTLFVLRTGEGSADPGPIDVFAPAGRYRGTVAGTTFPDAIGPGYIAAWVRPDELGVQRIIVGRLRLAER